MNPPKVLIKNLLFLAISQQAVSADITTISAVGYFSPKTEEQRQKQLGS
jgi:hypothetical protein